jgi:hypothetical protein
MIMEMTVMLKPHLWANHGFYTGDLDFFQVLNGRNGNPIMRNMLLDFAQLAQNENIELSFCFGTELEHSNKRPEYWSQLKKIKSTSGSLSYSKLG